jgi:hypothetical protein
MSSKFCNLRINLVLTNMVGVCEEIDCTEGMLIYLYENDKPIYIIEFNSQLEIDQIEETEGDWSLYDVKFADEDFMSFPHCKYHLDKFEKYMTINLLDKHSEIFGLILYTNLHVNHLNNVVSVLGELVDGPNVNFTINKWQYLYDYTEVEHDIHCVGKKTTRAGYCKECCVNRIEHHVFVSTEKNENLILDKTKDFHLMSYTVFSLSSEVKQSVLDLLPLTKFENGIYTMLDEEKYL